MKYVLLVAVFSLLLIPASAEAGSPKTYKTKKVVERHQRDIVPLPSCGNGNDFYDGGKGTDTIKYSGTRSEYKITKNLDKSFTVEDLVPCRADTDTVINIERFEFTDGTYTLSTLKPDAREKRVKK